MIYESWKYTADEVNFTSVYQGKHFNNNIFLHPTNFIPNAIWEFIGNYLSLGMFFFAFRKGAVICAGLRVDLSGTVVKKNARN